MMHCTGWVGRISIFLAYVCQIDSYITEFFLQCICCIAAVSYPAFCFVEDLSQPFWSSPTSTVGHLCLFITELPRHLSNRLGERVFLLWCGHKHTRITWPSIRVAFMDKRINTQAVPRQVHWKESSLSHQGEVQHTNMQNEWRKYMDKHTNKYVCRKRLQPQQEHRMQHHCNHNQNTEVNPFSWMFIGLFMFILYEVFILCVQNYLPFEPLGLMAESQVWHSRQVWRFDGKAIQALNMGWWQVRWRNGMSWSWFVDRSL